MQRFHRGHPDRVSRHIHGQHHDTSDVARTAVAVDVDKFANRDDFDDGTHTDREFDTGNRASGARGPGREALRRVLSRSLGGLRKPVP